MYLALGASPRSILVRFQGSVDGILSYKVEADEDAKLSTGSRGSAALVESWSQSCLVGVR